MTPSVSSLYDPGVRRVRRRRPAGQPQVPTVVAEPVAGATAVAPAVVRIGPDRVLLDSPWDMVDCSVAHVWLDDTVTGGLIRAAWPRHPWSRRPIAPLDLHLGHALEFSTHIEATLEVRYAFVAEVGLQSIVLVSAASVFDAVSMARRAVDVWKVAQLAAAEDAWHQRVEAAQRLYGEEI